MAPATGVPSPTSELRAPTVAPPTEVPVTPPTETETPPGVLTPLSAAALEVVGQIGGSARSLALWGTHAYVGLGPRLVVVDITDPRAPRVVGQSQVLGLMVEGVAVADGRAYLTAGQHGLWILDVADPAAPRVLGSLDTPGFASGLAVREGTVYVADGEAGLEIIDVADPAAPRLLAGVDTPGEACAVAIGGRYAYVADADQSCEKGSLQVIDVLHPAAPRLAASLAAGDVRGVALAGSLVYLAGNGPDPGYSGWLGVVDASDPTRPQQVAVFRPPLEGTFVDIAVAGNRAYLAYRGGELAYSRENWTTVDISNPTMPRDPAEPGQVRLGGIGAGCGIAVVEDLAYVASSQGLQVWQLLEGGRRSRLGATEAMGTVDYVAVSDGYAYAITDAAHAGSSQLRVVDVRDPARPLERGALPMPSYCESCLSAPTALAVAGGYAYVGLFEDGLQVVDVHDPSNPRLRGHLEMQVMSLAAAGHHAYPVVRGELHVVDAADPDRPVLVSTLAMTLAGWDKPVVVEEGFAYVLAAHAGQWAADLQVIDLSDPARPKLQGKIELPYPRRLAVADGRAYVVNVQRRETPETPSGISCTAELWVVSVDDPLSPRRVGVWGTVTGCDHAVAAAGRYVYLGGAIIDAGDPGEPRQIGAYEGGERGVVAVDDWVYVAGGEGGLFILRCVPTVGK